MDLFIPVIKKMKHSKNIDLKRQLPANGDLVIKNGENVVPFTKIGHSKVSKTKILLPKKLKISSKKVGSETFVYAGEKIGRLGLRSYKAPYNGYFTVENGSYYFNQEKKDTWVLSGVWGTVKNVEKGSHALITTSLVSFDFRACSSKNVMGELIVFPNPSELLDIKYLENFSNNTRNKIIYVGHHIRPELLEKAINMGVGSIIGGSINYEDFLYAKNNNFTVGIFSGFGKLQTPFHIFEFIKGVSNRHVFVNQSNCELQIPVPLDYEFNQQTLKNSLKKIESGLEVIIFTSTNFGKTGVIESIQNEKIYVKLIESDALEEVAPPNIFALV